MYNITQLWYNYIVNILLIAKFVQANVKYFNQYLAKTEIEILELVIIVQN